jgi:hypothetical protein
MREKEHPFPMKDIRPSFRIHPGRLLRFWIPACLIAFTFALTSCASGVNYPYISSSKQQKYQKKQQKKYGKVNEKNIPVKSNYKIRN